ncbi:hypothetical protein SAMN05421678_105338 [Actinopolymorpha cephalotaxi]|uniref:Uncharacterized protein n=1 Tax=Actinopolymorpha cephalotaxi TaxID=504797 RepID=A0A1I2REE8_9ACTN|nr:hypothetical protein SAMN05421678_105338 [Actinopolymorpha cephalotaxi]
MTVEGEQARRSGTEQGQRVEVVVAAEQPPVQARSRRAVTAGRTQQAELRTRVDMGADRDLRPHRLVGRTEISVPDGDHTASGEESRIGDHPRARGSDRLALRTEQVDAAVARAPRNVGGIEAVNDLRAR